MKKLALILFLPLLCFYGCVYLVAAGAGAAAGVVTYKYISGELQVQYPYPLERVWHATEEAVKEMGISVTERARDTFSGSLKGKTSTGTSVSIKAKQLEEKVTLVKIRVGIFGDEAASMRIKDAIDKKLGI
jgi:hypothetical protein